MFHCINNYRLIYNYGTENFEKILYILTNHKLDERRQVVYHQTSDIRSKQMNITRIMAVPARRRHTYWHAYKILYNIMICNLTKPNLSLTKQNLGNLTLNLRIEYTLTTDNS